MINDTNRIIRVDRSIKPPRSAYPSWEHELLHPELEFTGPEEFELGQWKADERIFGFDASSSVNGDTLHVYLEMKHLLHKFLGLADLLAIQARGLSFYRGVWRNYYEHPLYGWRSAVKDEVCHSWIPRLYASKEGVQLSWEEIKHNFYKDPIRCIAGI